MKFVMILAFAGALSAQVTTSFSSSTGPTVPADVSTWPEDIKAQVIAEQRRLSEGIVPKPMGKNPNPPPQDIPPDHTLKVTLQTCTWAPPGSGAPVVNCSPAPTPFAGPATTYFSATWQFYIAHYYVSNGNILVQAVTRNLTSSVTFVSTCSVATIIYSFETQKWTEPGGDPPYDYWQYYYGFQVQGQAEDAYSGNILMTATIERLDGFPPITSTIPAPVIICPPL